MYYSIYDTYTTQATDTMYTIANKYYCAWYLWPIVYDPNKDILGSDPFALPAGKEISIISLNTDEIEHTLIQGDTWHTLAKMYYATERFWPFIAQRNEYIHIVPGLIITIPALVSANKLLQVQELRNATA